MNTKLVPTTILETLERGGAQEFDDLYKQVGKMHGDLDERLFTDILMRLEIQGLVRVYHMARGKRRIELARG